MDTWPLLCHSLTEQFLGLSLGSSFPAPRGQRRHQTAYFPSLGLWLLSPVPGHLPLRASSSVACASSCICPCLCQGGTDVFSNFSLQPFSCGWCPSLLGAPGWSPFTIASSPWWDSFCGSPAMDQEHRQHFIPLCEPRSWLIIPALSPQRVPPTDCLELRVRACTQDNSRTFCIGLLG